MTAAAPLPVSEAARPAPPPFAPLSEPARAKPLGKDPIARIAALIADIDALLNAQLDAILHRPQLQQLEALWRNTSWLVGRATTSAALRVEILDCRWAELARDQERASTFEVSALYDKIYAQALGTPGGDPYGLIVIDHAFAHRPGGADTIDDTVVAERLAEVGAAAFCPVVFGAAPRLLQMDSFADLDLRQDLSGTFRGGEYDRFKRLRRTADSRFLACVMPRMLARTPHRGRSFARLAFRYDEAIDDHDDMLWGSPAFAVADVALRAMQQHRWPANIRGASEADSGGVVTGPAHILLPSDRAGVVSRYPTENAVAEAQEVALNAHGLIALRQCHLTSSAAFFNVPSMHAPEATSGMSNADARMGAMLNYVLCVSRFAHHIKVMTREWIGSFATAELAERRLRDWLSQYIDGSGGSDERMRARFPLREATVEVREDPGSPGNFHALVALRPHFQLDQSNADFVLTTPIGKPVNA